MKPTDPPNAPGPAPHQYPPEGLRNEDVAHEHSDIAVRPILLAAAALAAIGILVHVLMYGVWWVLDEQAKQSDPQVSPLAEPAVQMPPSTIQSPVFGTAPEPQLLTNEYSYLRRQRRAEQQQLTGYGWVNEAAGVARIPIEEAKKRLIERGLPVRGDAAADPTQGTNRPARGESSSGRIVDGPPRGSGLPEIAAPARAPQPQPGQPQKGGH